MARQVLDAPAVFEGARVSAELLTSLWARRKLTLVGETLHRESTTETDARSWEASGDEDRGKEAELRRAFLTPACAQFQKNATKGAQLSRTRDVTSGSRRRSRCETRLETTPFH